MQYTLQCLFDEWDYQESTGSYPLQTTGWIREHTKAMTVIVYVKGS